MYTNHPKKGYTDALEFNVGIFLISKEVNRVTENIPDPMGLHPQTKTTYEVTIKGSILGCYRYKTYTVTQVRNAAGMIVRQIASPPRISHRLVWEKSPEYEVKTKRKILSLISPFL